MRAKGLFKYFDILSKRCQGWIGVICVQDFAFCFSFWNGNWIFQISHKILSYRNNIMCSFYHKRKNVRRMFAPSFERKNDCGARPLNLPQTPHPVSVENNSIMFKLNAKIVLWRENCIFRWKTPPFQIFFTFCGEKMSCGTDVSWLRAHLIFFFFFIGHLVVGSPRAATHYHSLLGLDKLTTTIHGCSIFTICTK